MALSVAPSDGAVILSSAINPSNGHEYFVVTGEVSSSNPQGGLSWSEARFFATTFVEEGKSASLMSITSKAEEDWLLATFLDPGIEFASPFHFFWMDLTDEAVEGSFQWGNGEPLAYANWTGAGSPVDLNGVEDYAYFVNSTFLEPLAMRGQWNDSADERLFQGSIPFSAIIEVMPVPEPTLPFLVAIASLGALRRGRRSAGDLTAR